MEKSRIEKLYDAVAKEYGAHFSGDHEKKPMDREILGRFAREIGHRGPVWDFGCGPGQTSRYLTDLGLKISGLDLSEKILDEARALHPDIFFRQGDILDLSFEENSIAGVVAFYAIVHFTAEQVAISFNEIFRVLTPGGLFLLSFHVGEGPIRIEEVLGKKVCADFFFFTSGFIRKSLTNAGFEEIELIERDPYIEVEYQSRRGYAFARKPPSF